MREQFSFESTQLMIGTSTLDEAVSKMIALVCTNLGWDCGMYWAVAQSGSEAGRLVLTHYWSGEARSPSDVFEHAGGDRLSIAPREGVVGAVWSSGKARWIEDIATDPEFLYPAYAHKSGIHSGYAFPVAYDSDDGRRHRPGVLIFFSCLSRQRTAQLPKLSAAIGGLIAQTAQRLAQQEDIRSLAQVDALSGLANRRHFHDLLDGACHRAASRQVPLGVLFIDLDRFKPINDGLGHAVGDAVLSQFAQRLAALTPRGAYAGRVGGDEFALFFYPGDGASRMRELVEQVLLAARTRFVVDERELVISASVGVSMYPADGATSAELLRNADTAMYSAKRGGRNGVSFYSDHPSHGDAQSRDALELQLTVEAELMHALAGGHLFLEYQPVFDTTTSKVRAVEALVRWRRPDGSIVAPDVFIPVAEQSHLIVDIGRWVIRQACADLARLHAAGMAELQLNVNMAAREFMNASLPGEISIITRGAGIAPRHLCLELTEGMMMNHPEQVIPVMRALRDHGFRISVDDFGMGYSSLSRLKDLPISSLKVDRSFVRGLPDDHQDRAMVQTIVDIGRNMQLEVIAEGVETEAQLMLLRSLGCTLIQGYLTGRPISLEQLIEMHGV
jgi:diguanylate cyclase (GGDEF)-like protein